MVTKKRRRDRPAWGPREKRVCACGRDGGQPHWLGKTTWYYHLNNPYVPSESESDIEDPDATAQAAGDITDDWEVVILSDEAREAEAEGEGSSGEVQLPGYRSLDEDDELGSPPLRRPARVLNSDVRANLPMSTIMEEVSSDRIRMSSAVARVSVPRASSVVPSTTLAPLSSPVPSSPTVPLPTASERRSQRRVSQRVSQSRVRLNDPVLMEPTLVPMPRRRSRRSPTLQVPDSQPEGYHVAHYDPSGDEVYSDEPSYEEDILPVISVTDTDTETLPSGQPVPQYDNFGRVRGYIGDPGSSDGDDSDSSDYHSWDGRRATIDELRDAARNKQTSTVYDHKAFMYGNRNPLPLGIANQLRIWAVRGEGHVSERVHDNYVRQIRIIAQGQEIATPYVARKELEAVTGVTPIP